MALSADAGLLVSSAKRAGNADRSGLRGGTKAVRYYSSSFNIGGDIVVSVDGMKVAAIADLYSALEDNKPGDTVKVEFWRGSKLMKVDVVLADRAEYMKKK